MKLKKIVAIATAVLSLTALSACANTNASPNVEKQELTTLNVGYLPSPGHLLYFIAQEEGFFTEEGLDVNLVLFNENNSELAALESGKLDVGAFGSSNLVGFLADGHDLTVFGGAMIAGQGVIVKEDVVEGIPEDQWSLELLKGKTIAVEPLNTGYVVYREILKKLGYEDQINFKTFSDGSEVYNALKNDDIDAAIVYTPYRILAENEGYVILSNSGSAEGFENHVCCRQAALTSSLESDPEKYVSFLRALIKSYKFYKENKSESIDDIAKYVDVNKDSLEADTYNYDEEIANPDPDTNRIMAFYDALVDQQLIDEFDIEKSLSNELYEKALNSIIDEHPDDATYKKLEEYHNQSINEAD